MIRALMIFAFVTTQVHAFTIPEVEQVGRCQKGIASAGAKFALKSIRATLKCTNAVTDCQVQCDYGVFGPSCNSSGAPCCDSDDTGSNTAFAFCMADATTLCAEQNANINGDELTKQAKIVQTCG